MPNFLSETTVMRGYKGLYVVDVSFAVHVFNTTLESELS